MNLISDTAAYNPFYIPSVIPQYGPLLFPLIDLQAGEELSTCTGVTSRLPLHSL